MRGRLHRGYIGHANLLLWRRRGPTDLSRLKKTVGNDEQHQKHQGAKPYRVTRGGIGPAEHTKAQRHQDRDKAALVNAIHDRGQEAITGA